jgi:hypothetical protein
MTAGPKDSIQIAISAKNMGCVCHSRDSGQTLHRAFLSFASKLTQKDNVVKRQGRKPLTTAKTKVDVTNSDQRSEKDHKDKQLWRCFTRMNVREREE